MPNKPSSIIVVTFHKSYIKAAWVQWEMNASFGFGLKKYFRIKKKICHFKISRTFKEEGA